jgi:hypothetical protein
MALSLSSMGPAERFLPAEEPDHGASRIDEDVSSRRYE